MCVRAYVCVCLMWCVSWRHSAPASWSPSLPHLDKCLTPPFLYPPFNLALSQPVQRRNVVLTWLLSTPFLSFFLRFSSSSLFLLFSFILSQALSLSHCSCSSWMVVALLFFLSLSLKHMHHCLKVHMFSHPIQHPFFSLILLWKEDFCSDSGHDYLCTKQQ